VWFSDLSLEAAERAAEHSAKAGHAVAGALALDVSNADSIAAMMQLTHAQPIDVLVNNAGIQHVSKLEVGGVVS
jgi:3-hydroxybutyrate dehydrogenase